MVKIIGGLIVQWGDGTAGNVHNVDITFPTSFTSTNYYAQANENKDSDTNNGWGYASNKSKTGCKFAEQNCTFKWIAIGY